MLTFTKKKNSQFSVSYNNITNKKRPKEYFPPNSPTTNHEMAPPVTERWCLALILLFLSLFVQSSTAIYCGAEDCYALLGFVHQLPIFIFKFRFWFRSLNRFALSISESLKMRTHRISRDLIISSLFNSKDDSGFV